MCYTRTFTKHLNGSAPTSEWAWFSDQFLGFVTREEVDAAEPVVLLFEKIQSPPRLLLKTNQQIFSFDIKKQTRKQTLSAEEKTNVNLVTHAGVPKNEIPDFLAGLGTKGIASPNFPTTATIE